MTLSSEFAFEGFRLFKKKPWLFVAWGLSYVLIVVAVIAAMIGPIMQFVQHAKDFESASQSAKPDFKVILDFYASLMPVMAIAAPIGLIGAAMFRTAVFRAESEPNNKGLLYF